MDDRQILDRFLLGFGQAFVRCIGARELCLTAGGRKLPGGEERTLGQRLIDGHPVDVPEEGPQYVLGLGIDLLVESDRVDVFLTALAGARRLPVVVRPLTELVRESQLLGIRQILARKDQYSSVLQSLSNRRGRLVVEKVLPRYVDDAADSRLDLFDA